MALRESLLEIIGKLIQRTDAAEVADHGDVLAPVVGLVVEAQRPAGEADVEVAETVLDLAVHQVGVVPVQELVVAGVGLHLGGDTCRERVTQPDVQIVM